MGMPPQMPPSLGGMGPTPTPTPAPTAMGPTTLEGPRSVATAAGENILTRFGRRKRKHSRREGSFRGYRAPMAYTKTPESNAASVRSGLTNLDSATS